MALRFRLGLVDLIESNRRRSKATPRIWRLKSGQRRPEDEMQECNGYCMTDPKYTHHTCKVLLITNKEVLLYGQNKRRQAWRPGNQNSKRAYHLGREGN